jgi:predicted O-methyltransferase YrrM
VKNLGKQTFRNVLEIGIAKGGSTVWLSELLNPEKLVAVDISARPVEALERYRRESGRTQQLVTYYGVDQKDEQMLRQICNLEFDNQPFDLIVEDASHYFPETLSTFNFLFPKLAPGGLYVIEDWAWSTQMIELKKEQARAPIAVAMDQLYAGKEPLEPLTCFIVLAAADAGNMVDGVYVDKYSTYVRRGNGRAGARFDVAAFNRFHDGSCLSVAPRPPAARPLSDLA